MRPFLSALLMLSLCAACVGSEDTASNVKDLRVLAVQTDPSELYADVCSTDVTALVGALVKPVRLTALIADPAGDGRDLDYTLWACASQSDDTCKDDHVELARGTTKAGELVLDLFPGPGVARLPDGSFLAQEVLQKDTYQGLGGLRMPLVLWVRGGSEQIYAQKLMVYGCPFFPDMKPNVMPVLPSGLLLEGEAWDEGVPRALSGRGPFRVDLPDVSALEESYIVPSFELQPVHLQESWRFSFYATLGSFTPESTGGTDLGGQSGNNHASWKPPRDAQAQTVTFWIVTRDGRGGISWVTRTVDYTP